VPSKHWANVSQIDVESALLHGCPSGMTAGHVPPQFPTRHLVVSLQGCPADTQVTLVQTPSAHPRPAAQ